MTDSAGWYAAAQTRAAHPVAAVTDFVNQAMLPQLRAAMHDAVTYRGGCGMPESSRSLPMRSIASRWLDWISASRKQRFLARILRA